MQYILKSGHDAALKALKTGDTSEADAITEYNTGILTNIFNNLISGAAAAYYQRTESHYIILHRSTRDGVLIQASHSWIINGDVIPCSHSDINNFSDLLEKQPFYKNINIKEYIAA